MMNEMAHDFPRTVQNPACYDNVTLKNRKKSEVALTKRPHLVPLDVCLSYRNLETVCEYTNFYRGYLHLVN